MTIVVVIAAYIFGAVSGIFFTALMISGKEMDEKIRELEDEENE